MTTQFASILSLWAENDRDTEKREKNHKKNQRWFTSERQHFIAHQIGTCSTEFDAKMMMRVSRNQTTPNRAESMKDSQTT